MTISLQTAFNGLFKTPERWMTNLFMSICMNSRDGTAYREQEPCTGAP
jgi:hypothetical protein